MDSRTKYFVQENAASLYADFCRKSRPGDDERWSLHQAYRLLELIEETPYTATGLSKVIKLSAPTIFDYIGALEAGGVPISRGVLKNGKEGRDCTVFSLDVPVIIEENLKLSAKK